MIVDSRLLFGPPCMCVCLVVPDARYLLHLVVGLYSGYGRCAPPMDLFICPSDRLYPRFENTYTIVFDFYLMFGIALCRRGKGDYRIDGQIFWGICPMGECPSGIDWTLFRYVFQWLTGSIDSIKVHVLLTVNGRPIGQFYLFIYLFINWFIKRHKVVTSEAPFIPRDGRNHIRYSLHLHTEGWPGWVAWINTGMAYPLKP